MSKDDFVVLIKSREDIKNKDDKKMYDIHVVNIRKETIRVKTKSL